ncbi:MAG: hypothetical protein DRJ56_08050 [Thermoprotei archaeon]|nr:MAG: hypothetical protein DRJ56_08050 [Thermoprotei archaeon]
MLRLPHRMEEVLLMACGEGVSGSEIANRLGVSRQAVSRALREARARLTQMFLELAEVLNADVVRVSSSGGFAVLRSRQTGRRMYVLYVPGSGPAVLFEGELDCSGANRAFCEKLLRAAARWGLISEAHEDPRRALAELVRRMEE